MASDAGNHRADVVVGIHDPRLAPIDPQEVQVPGLAVALGTVGRHDRRVILVPVDKGFGLRVGMRRLGPELRKGHPLGSLSRRAFRALDLGALGLRALRTLDLRAFSLRAFNLGALNLGAFRALGAGFGGCTAAYEQQSQGQPQYQNCYNLPLHRVISS
jgi:hypothetical protein